MQPSFLKIFFLFLLIIFLFSAGDAFAIGVSPAKIEINNILKGTTFEKKIVLSRMDMEKDIMISITKEGEISDWIEIEEYPNFIYPANKKQLPIKVRFKIPNDASTGTYEGRIRFMTEPTAPGYGGASVAMGIGAVSKIMVSVGHREVKTFEVLAIGVEEARVGKKLSFGLKLFNTGNVKIQPSRIEVDLFDKYRKREFGSFETKKFLGFVSAKETGKVLATIPYKPRIAGYMWAKVRVFDYEGNRISPDEKEDIIFEVMPGRGFSIMPFVILISTCLLLVGTICLLPSRVKKEYGFKIIRKVKTWKGKTNKTSRAKRKKQKTMKTKQKTKKRKGK